MAVTPIVTGDFQEFFYPMFEDGQETSSTTGTDITAWEDIPLLNDSLYRITLTGHYTGTTLTTMQLAFAFGHTPNEFSMTCHLYHSLSALSPVGLNAPNTFTTNSVVLLTAQALPFHCQGLFTVEGSQSTLTARFRSLLALNAVEILPGSMLKLECLRVPQP